MERKKKKTGFAFYEGNSWYHRLKKVDETGKVIYSKKGGFATEEEAEKSYYLYDEEFKKENRKLLMRQDWNQEIGFKDYLQYWFEELYSKRVESTTRMIGAYTLYHLILPCAEKDMKLKFLNTEYLNELLGRVAGLTSSSGNKGREFISLALKDAVSEGKLKDNPIQFTKTYPRKKPKVTVLSKEGIKVLMKAASQSEWYLEIMLALFCGLRKGEILGLKFSDVDFDLGTIWIRRQITSNPIIPKGQAKVEEYKIIEKEPKTENSFRKLSAPVLVMEEIRKRKEKVEKLSLGGKFIDRDYISCQNNGLPHSITSMNSMLTRLCKANALPHITVHGLRHMYATILLEQGVSLQKISALLGHASVSTTFEYYCEQMDENNRIISFMNEKFREED